MSTTHRTHAGDFEVCPAPEACELLFHFPGMTPAGMALVPEQILWTLCEVVDPPMFQNDTGNTWGTPEVEVHRDYDLPAYIAADGHFREWYEHGQRHREGGKPAFVVDGGLVAWFHHGMLHREDGPAVINGMDRGAQLYVRLPDGEADDNPNAQPDGQVPIQFSAHEQQFWRYGKRVNGGSQ